MRRWRRSLCALLLFALLLGLCPGAGAAADGSDIIFLALNDSMPYTLSSGTMPYWSGGQLYVHSTTFDITSINLSASYNASNMTLLIYSGTGRRSLTFYLSEGYVQTQSGATEEVTAAMRGDQVFLPLDYCAGFFGLGVSYLTSLEGWPLVRLTTGAQVWEDSFFIEQANKLINDRAEKYMDSFKPPVTPPPAVIEPQPPTPVVPPVSDPVIIPQDPVVEPDPPEDEPVKEPDPVEEPEQPPLTVYPALVGIDAVESAMDLLAVQRMAVYLEADEILDHSDLVRQLYGAGHSIGVMGDLDAANDALDLVLCRRSLMTLNSPDEAFFVHYSTHIPDTLETADEASILLRLEDSSAGEILTELLDNEATLLQLRETTTLFQTHPEPPAESAEEVPKGVEVVDVLE